ncbi:hypothetical protein [Natronorubrum sediminis]|uniref:hypothetical protein n=1 Tax=Natronorubrum sediminis TaxID=640943 RepID=UPI00158715B0|nr:hypothetical protein [Natronorubrum sediminis]
MCSEFVPASELYHVESETHRPSSHQVSNVDVRHALEAEGERQLRAGDGTDSSGPERSN